jgi:hypothetical protein
MRAWIFGRHWASALAGSLVFAVACSGSGVGVGGDGESPKPETCNGVDDNLDGNIDETGCEEPVEQFGRHAYLFVRQLKSWEDARAHCAARGYHLVTIDSAEENAFLDETTKSKAVFNISWWIGLNDRAAENSFTWEDGTPLGYTNWGTNQPDNFFEEDCVEIVTYTADGRWNDIGCLTAHYFICEAGR